MKKLSLQREGYNVSTVSDPLFFFDSSKGGYRPLDHATYDDLVNLQVRL